MREYYNQRGCRKSHIWRTLTRNTVLFIPMYGGMPEFFNTLDYLIIRKTLAGSKIDLNYQVIDEEL